MKHGKLERCWYRSVGSQLLNDAIVVEFTVHAKKYQHTLPNKGWSLQTPALQFFGYAGIRPTDFGDSKYSFDGHKEIAVVEQNGMYAIAESVLEEGQVKLMEADWFNLNGTVFNSEEHAITGSGNNTNGGSGNPAEIILEG